VKRDVLKNGLSTAHGSRSPLYTAKDGDKIFYESKNECIDTNTKDSVWRKERVIDEFGKDKRKSQML